MAQWRCGRIAPASLRRSPDSYFGSATPIFRYFSGDACDGLHLTLFITRMIVQSLKRTVIVNAQDDSL
ncbi:MAG: hypothetical protein PUP93_33800 [Rhizonema sp. NSF051]|nr:hypothetical protein [Rhizonema sp. NSF051]